MSNPILNMQGTLAMRGDMGIYTPTFRGAFKPRPACLVVAQASRLADVTQPPGLQSSALEVRAENPPSRRYGVTAASRETCATNRAMAGGPEPSWSWRAGDSHAGSFRKRLSRESNLL